MAGHGEETLNQPPRKSSGATAPGAMGMARKMAGAGGACVAAAAVSAADAGS